MSDLTLGERLVRAFIQQQGVNPLSDDEMADLASVINSHPKVKQLVEERRISDELGRLNDDLSQRVEQLVEDRERLDKLNELTPEGGELHIVAEDGGIWLEQKGETEHYPRGLSDPCNNLREAIDAATGSNQAKKEEEEVFMNPEPQTEKTTRTKGVTRKASSTKRVVTSCVDGCGSAHLSETNHYYVCLHCGMTYSK